MRSFFMRHASRKLKNCNLLLAESAFDDISKHAQFSFRNIAHFEHLLAQVVDCVVIFPESPGSFAELGFFAHSEARKITLVVNRLDLQSVDSFINAGVIDYIDRDSAFRSQIHLEFDRKAAPDFSPVIRRLERLNVKAINRKRLDLNAADHRPPQILMYLLTYIITTCRVIHVDDLRALSADLFNEGESIEQFDELISFCLGSELIARVGPGNSYLVTTSRANPFIEIDGWDVKGATVTCVQFYQKHVPEVYDLLRVAS